MAEPVVFLNHFPRPVLSDGNDRITLCVHRAQARIKVSILKGISPSVIVKALKAEFDLPGSWTEYLLMGPVNGDVYAHVTDTASFEMFLTDYLFVFLHQSEVQSLCKPNNLVRSCIFRAGIAHGVSYLG